jgi:hypothetical protein
MQILKLKLKQASAILGVSPKELQNLVQLRVLRPSLRNQVYWFDFSLLLQAKVAFYLKESLGSSSDRLARFTRTLAINLKNNQLDDLQDVSLRSRPVTGKDPVEIKIPLRSLALELKKALPRAAACRDLPRGRKRPGWKKDFLRSLQAAAVQMGDVSDDEILKTVRETRGTLARRKRLPVTLEEALKLSLSESTMPVSVPRGPRSPRKKLPEITFVASTKTKTA